MRYKLPLKITAIVLGSLAGLIALLLGLVAIVLTPGRLTPLVEEVCDEFLEAEVRFDTVQLSLFEEFPYTTVSLRQARIISHVPLCGVQADTLASVAALDLSIDPIKALFGELDVKRIRLTNTHLHTRVDSTGRANYDIVRPSQDTTTSDSGTPLAIAIQRITLRDGLHLHYVNRRDSVACEVELRSLHLRGLLTADLTRLDPERLILRAAHMELIQALGDTLRESRYAVDLDSVALRGSRDEGYTMGVAGRTIEGVLPYPLDSLSVSGFIRYIDSGAELRGVRVAINEIGIKIDGSVRADSTGAVDLDQLTIVADSLPLQRIMSRIPAHLTGGRSYVTDLRPTIRLATSGRFRAADSERAMQLPTIEAALQIPVGALRDTQAKGGAQLDTVAMDIKLNYDPQNPHESQLKIDRLKISGFGIRLESDAVISDIMGDPLFDGMLRGRVDFTRLATQFPSPSGVTLRGVVDLDIKGKVAQSNLRLDRLGSIMAVGHVACDTLRVKAPAEGFDLMVGRSKATFGSGLSRGDSLLSDLSGIVGIGIDIDTIDMDINKTICLQARRLHFTARSDSKLFAGDTTAIYPAAGELSADRLKAILPDSVSMNGARVALNWQITPAPTAPNVPLLECKIKARRAGWRSGSERYSLREAAIGLQATLYAIDSTRINLRLDSLQRTYPDITRNKLIDHLRAQRAAGSGDNTMGNLDLAIDDKSTQALIRRWDLRGAIEARSGRIITPYFPLRTSLRSISLTFTTDRVSLSGIGIKAGESDIRVTGELRGLRRAMLGSGRIRGELSVVADTLNINQILHAVDAGSQLMAYGGVSQVESDEQMEQQIMMSIDSAATDYSALVVPGNLDLTISLTVGHGLYSTLRLDSLTTHLAVRGRAIRLSDFVMHSDSGETRLSGIYATRSLHDIQAGFEIDMKRMHIERLIGLIPSIDTLMPMLRSFRGVVDCGIAMTTRVDSAMNLVLATLNGACNINGRNLVLMDGETFAEISKSLMFKHKAHNIIDHISAQVLVSDSMIQVFPFVITMDRYRAAVSGVHRLDMSFNYHISVLQSPVPFRLGVDVYGDLNDFKFRVTRARYKSADIPSRIELIDTTRLNLRHYMNELFARGANASVANDRSIAPKVATPEQTLPKAEALPADSLELVKEALGGKI